jgi:hypothetical protein
MRKLLEDRIRLIRSLIFANQTTKKLSPEHVETLALVIKKIREDDLRHFLSYSQEEEEKISYATKPDFRGDNKRRTKTTLSRYLRRNYTDLLKDIPEHVLMEFVRFTSSKLVTLGEFQIITGDKIVEAYESSIGESSCMTGENDYTKFYAINPKVSMVIYDQKARALLWECDCGHRILDRIYPNDGCHVPIIHNWAKEHGILTRVNNSLPDEDYVQVSDNGDHVVTMNLFRCYPYLDTFHFGDIVDSRVVLRNTKKDCSMIFDHTAGGYSTSSCIICERCSGEADEEDFYYVDREIWCYSCYDDYAGRCTSCNELFPGDDLIYLEDSESSLCSRCCDRYTAPCKDCTDLFLTEEMTGIGEELVCNRCMDDYTRCSECWSYEKNVTKIGKHDYCDECRDDKFIFCSECDEWAEGTCNCEVKIES